MPQIGFIARVLFESISLQLKAIFPSWTPFSSYSNFPLIQSSVFTLLCSLRSPLCAPQRWMFSGTLQRFWIVNLKKYILSHILVSTFSVFKIVENMFLSTFNKIIGRFMSASYKPVQLFALFYQSQSFSGSQLLNTKGFVAQILPSSAKSRRISSCFSAVCFAQNPPDLSDLSQSSNFIFFSCCLRCMWSHSIRGSCFSLTCLSFAETRGAFHGVMRRNRLCHFNSGERFIWSERAHVRNKQATRRGGVASHFCQKPRPPHSPHPSIQMRILLFISSCYLIISVRLPSQPASSSI